ncbi:MAG: DNA-formamidopyrimidine glycosylase [Phycisphaerae bacterium]|nr:DNA-formamidopyrimidine glycosylase [Phycisphaerae bacterium]MBM92046.1 DNA-formamidopyrimidine glycosylase [Phycisphaerae bacterium]
MPELPEVETVRRGLLPIIGHRIVGCDVRRRDVVRDRTQNAPNPRRGRINPESLGIGSRISDLLRVGKQLAMLTQDEQGHERVIVVQLGMSGQVALIDTKTIPDAKHAHVVWSLDDARRVVFRDARRFGGVTLLPSRVALDGFWSSLGPDALSITTPQLRAGLNASTRMIKAALLDQGVLAGVGNIYADEALHRAGIDPRTPCDALTSDQTKHLASSIRSVLRTAVKARGSTLRDYRDTNDQPGGAQLLHRVYNRAGEPCPDCGCPIEHTRIAQRSTCWCPRCQPSQVVPSTRG